MQRNLNNVAGGSKKVANQNVSKPLNQSKKTPRKSRPFDMMSAPSSTRAYSVPTTFYSTTVDPTWLRMEGKIHHPELGGGVRICGRQLLTSITTTAGDSQLFATNGATLRDSNSIYLSPDTLNGRLALQARTYDRYLFRKVRLTYVSRIPTSQAGSMALGYVADPVIPALTFAVVTSMNPCLQSSFHPPLVHFDIVNDMTSQKTFFTTSDNTSDASRRLTYQGIIVGTPDVTSIGAVTMGYLYVDYMIDLYQPTLDQGFALRLTKEEEEFLVKRRESTSLSTFDENLNRERPEKNEKVYVNIPVSKYPPRSC